MPHPSPQLPSAVLLARPRVPEPPPKDAEPTADNVHALQTWLDAVTAYSAYAAGQPWRFYEELEAYLGPFGSSGYLLSYGTTYCRLFYEHGPLNRSAVGEAWVRRTLLLLQAALKRLVLDRFRAGTLGSLSADELKRAAFESHARAYTEGGLGLVGKLSLKQLGHIALIPAAELLPGSSNFRASWMQVFATSGMAVMQALEPFAGRTRALPF